MRLHLRVVSGIQIGDECHLDPPGGMIGRGDGTQLCLHDSSVSRTHLELRFADGWWAIQHSTRSPTLVDGAVLTTQPLRLHPQGQLQVGKISIEYLEESAQLARIPDASPESVAPTTMINIRSRLPALQQEILPQMMPLRSPEPASQQAPPTLILRRPPLEEQAAPPTLIRPAAQVLPPPIPMTSRVHTPVMDSAQVHALRQQSVASPTQHCEEREQLRSERDKLRQERDQLRQELDRLANELQQTQLDRDRLTSELQRVAAQPSAQAEAPQVRKPTSSSTLPTEALQLLLPFSESLERASDALKEGDAVRARHLIRDASFGLADLRDLFESACA